MLKLLIIFLILIFCSAALADGQLVNTNDTFKFFKGTVEPSAPVSAWRESDFDDSAWSSGEGPFGYGSAAHESATCNTVLNDMQDSYLTVYLRKKFVISDTNVIENLLLNLRYDDGIIVWINGYEVSSLNAPNPPNYNSTAPINHEAENIEPYTLYSPHNYLVEGTNVIAVQGFNLTSNSSDFILQVQLDYLEKVDKPEQPDFSLKHGFFFAPNVVTLSTISVGCQIRYTTDSSEPTETNGFDYISPIIISNTTCLRAATFSNSTIRSEVETKTYIFPVDVLTQTGDEFPTNWGTVKKPWYGTNKYREIYGWDFPYEIGSMFMGDYSINSNVVNNPLYSSTFTNDLLSIPSISIVAPTEDLFGPNGIYIDPNSSQHGDLWERAASAELIDPAGSESFQINCGLRIQGGYSRNTCFSPKHSFRLLFKEEYGKTKLKQKLFQDSKIDSFDTLVLRSCFNFGWAGTINGQESKAQYLRDPFIRNIQNDMGQVCGHSRHVHLYVNGMYWGLYILTERPDESFAASYFGGDKDSYDAMNAGESEDGSDNGKVINGDRIAWDEMFDIVHPDSWTGSSSQYAQIHEYLDVSRFVDYSILNHWAANYDWPRHNWRAVRKRGEGNGYKFMAWDEEWTVTYLEPPWGIGDLGDLKNVINITKIKGSNTNNPGHLFWQLADNDEFKLLYADHVHRHCFNNGVLYIDPNNISWDTNYPSRTPLSQRWYDMAENIERAVIPESARWGDTWTTNPYVYTKNVEWDAERDYVISDWLIHRTTNYLQICRNEGFYPNIDAPSFSQYGGHFDSGFYLAITNENGSGTIYYTLDGSEPRTPYSGTPSANAAEYSSPLIFTNSVYLKSRTLSGGEWSALNESVFFNTNDFENLRITEIMYNPPGGSDYEFIELKNVGKNPFPLTSLKFNDGIYFDFPYDTILGTGEFAVLVSQPDFFTSRYPNVEIAGRFIGKLNNGGETVAVYDSLTSIVESVYYRDGWFASTDGNGFSLVLKNLTGDPNEKSSWRPSSFLYGSPGKDDPVLPTDGIVINELLAHTDPPLQDAVELYNSSSNDIALDGWFLSDSAANLKKYEIQGGVIIPATGYVVFYEYQFSSGSNGFRFSSKGEEVHLSSSENPPTYYVSESFGASENGMSFGRYITASGSAHFVTMSNLTFGTDVKASDPPSRSNDFILGTGAVNSEPKIGPVVIYEFMYNSPGKPDEEYIELYNFSDEDIPLFNSVSNTEPWIIKDDSGVAYNFETGNVIKAGGLVVVVGEGVDPNAFRTKFNIPIDVPVWGPCLRSFGNSGDAVKLFKPDQTEITNVPYILVEQVEYDDVPPWPVDADGVSNSLQRIAAMEFANDPYNWEPGGTPGRIVPEPCLYFLILWPLILKLKIK